MIITFYSFLMSVLFSGLFIVGIYHLRRKSVFLRSSGLSLVLFLYALCAVRAVLFFELSFTLPVPLRGIYSALVRHVRVTEFSVGGSQVGLLELYCALWFSIAAFFILRFLRQRNDVRRKLAQYVANNDAYAERVLERVKSESWRTPSVSLCVCPSLDVPMGFGLLHGRIYLPDKEYTEDELYYILKHEYTHFCNRDLLIKFLVQILCCVFWWNPVMYLMKKDISMILEIRCDWKATEKFDRGKRAEYFLTIVRIMKRNADSTHNPPLIQVTGLIPQKREKDSIQERFESLINPVQPVSRLRKAAFCIAAVGVLFLSYTFVIQPQYDPPVEDYFVDDEGERTVCEITPSNSYLTKENDDLYRLSVFFDTGKTEIFLAESEVKKFLDIDIPLKGE